MSNKQKAFAGLALVATGASTFAMNMPTAHAAAHGDGRNIGYNIGTGYSGNYYADGKGNAYCADEGSVASGRLGLQAKSWNSSNVSTFRETTDGQGQATTLGSTSVSPANVAKLNYILTKYGTTTNAAQASAVENFLRQVSMGSAKQKDEWNNHVWPYVPQASKDAYAKILADANKNAGPYTMKVVWTTKPTATTQGVGYVQVTSASGNAVPGVHIVPSATGGTIHYQHVTSDATGKLPFSVNRISANGATVTVTAKADGLAASTVNLLTPASFPSSQIQRMVLASPTTSLTASATATVTPLKIGTTATNNDDGSKNVAPGSTVKDVISYTGLTPGQTYTMAGSLVDKATDAAIPGATGSTKFVASSTGSGTVVVRMDVPSSFTDKVAIYVNENLYNGATATGTPVSTNSGKTDTNETVNNVPSTIKIGTVATDVADGDKTIVAGGTAQDVISYTGLNVGTSYTMHADVVDSTGNVIGSADQTFTPTSADGNVTVKTTVPVNTPGQKIYFNETLKDSTSGDTLSFNSGKNDANETLTVEGPTLATDAENAATSTKYLPSGGGTVADTVNYTGLQVGQTYTINGSLVDQNTGDVIKGATGSTTFTATQSDGSVVVKIALPAGAPTGADVATESLTANGKVIAVHNDLNDKAQTVYVVQIGTTATNAANGSNVISSTGGKINDVIAYDGLVGGQTYTIQGTLMDQVTGKSTGITTTGSFVADSDGNGTTQVTFNVPARANADSLVAYENLLVNGKVVAQHTDIHSPSQTVNVTVPAPTTKVVSVHYEKDVWKMANASATSTAKRVVADHAFGYREDVSWNRSTGRVSSAPLWDAKVHVSSVEGFLNVTVPANATAAQITAAEKAAIAKQVGVTSGSFATPTQGKTLVVGWMIPANGWDKNASWKQASKYAAQIEVGAKSM